MNKNKIQDLAFVDPSGKNLSKIRTLVNDVLNIIFKKLTNAEKSTPLPTSKWNDDGHFNDLPVSEKKILEKIEFVIKKSMNAANPYFVGHMNSLPTTMSIIGDIITTSLNNNMISKETAPIFTDIEKSVMNELAKKFRLGENSGGIMLSGGHLANLQALAIARNRFINCYKKGLVGVKKKPYIFASSSCHTSVHKAAMVLGLGTDSLVLVPTDAQDRMDVKKLRILLDEKIKEGGVPFCVIATAGTTITGSIDPLKEISEIVDEYKLWLHTDAVYGGALIFSKQYQNKLQGIENSDSISFNPQKWLYITKVCSALLIKEEEFLYSDFLTPLPYIQRQNNEPHLGEISIQGTRCPDIFKFWLSFQHLGQITYSKIIDKSYENTQLFKKEINNRKYLKLICEPEMNILCFRYEPENIEANHWNELNIKMQKFLLKYHKIFLSICRYQEKDWLRVVILNPFFSLRHIKKIFEAIDEFEKRNNNNKKISIEQQ